MTPSTATEPALVINRAASYEALLSTGLGALTFALDAEKSTKAVNSFVFLARKGFYDGTTIHRLVSNFVAQGGSPDGGPTGDAGYLIEGELPPESEPAYPLGVLALAEYHTDDESAPPKQGSQFFITLGDLSGVLYRRSPVVGRLLEGFDVIDQLNSTSTDAGEAPERTITIERVTITES